MGDIIIATFGLGNTIDYVFEHNKSLISKMTPLPIIRPVQFLGWKCVSLGMRAENKPKIIDVQYACVHKQ